MKKTYVIPTFMVVKIKTSGMIATSLQITDTSASTTDGEYDDARFGGFEEEEY